MWTEHPLQGDRPRIKCQHGVCVEEEHGTYVHCLRRANWLPLAHNTHHRRFQLWSRHLLKDAYSRLTQGEQTRKFDRPLLQLEFRACGIFRQYLRNAVLLWLGSGRPSGNLCQCGEEELAN